MPAGTGLGGSRFDVPDHRGGWRRLGVFWLAVGLVMATGAGTLAVLGPPPASSLATRPLSTKAPAASVAQSGAHVIPSTPAGAAHVAGSGSEHKAGLLPAGPATVVARPAQTGGQLTGGQLMVGRTTPGPVADPDPALLEPSGVETSGLDETSHLPRIAADGRISMQAYAAGFDASSRRPRVGVLLAGVGLNEAESAVAIRTLPGSVSLAISPYTGTPTKLLATARIAGHEYLIAIPLEPAGFPLNDPGPATLLTGASEAANARNLRWVLSRIDGYAGATGIIGLMRGERLAAMTDQMDAVLTELAGRGLFYIDPREGGGPVAKAWGRHVELVIDEQPDRGSIDAKLAELEQQARDHGSALGLVMRPSPVAVARIAAWSNGLMDRGLALVPASALAMPPADVPVKVSERDH